MGIVNTIHIFRKPKNLQATTCVDTPVENVRHIQCTLYSIHYSIHCNIVCSIHYNTLYIQNTLHSTQYTVYCTHYTVYTIQYTLHIVRVQCIILYSVYLLYTACPRMSVPKVNLHNFGSTLSISVL